MIDCKTNSIKEKAAGMLDTSGAALITTHIDSTTDAKRLASLRARAAIAGIVLHAIENDCGKTVYIFTKWATTREIDSIGIAEMWLDMVMGVRHG